MKLQRMETQDGSWVDHQDWSGTLRIKVGGTRFDIQEVDGKGIAVSVEGILVAKPRYANSMNLFDEGNT